MAIKYNSASDIVQEIKYNNNDVKIFFYDGRLVWAKPYKLTLSESDRDLFTSIKTDGATDEYERNPSGKILTEGEYIFHGETLLINNLYSHTVTNGYLTYDLHATFTVYSSNYTPSIDFNGIVGDVCIDWGDGEVTTDRLEGVAKGISKSLNYTIDTYPEVKVVITNSMYSNESAYIRYTPEDSVESFNFKRFTVTRLPVDFMSSNYHITNVTLNEGLQIIEDSAFYDCNSLQEVTLPESLKEIWMDAFRDCYSLSSINLPNNLIKLGSGAFAGCELLSTISIPGTVELDPEGDTDIFAGCRDLSNVQLGEGLTSLSIGIFSDCSSLQNIVLPESLEIINAKAFHSSGLTSITIPNKVRIIEEDAFSYSRNLTTINIPESVQEINGHAFSQCNLQTVTVKPGYWTKTLNDNPDYVYYIKTTYLPNALMNSNSSVILRPYTVTPITFSKNYISGSSSAYTFNGSITNSNPFSIETFTCVRTSSKVGCQQRNVVTSELDISVGSLTGSTITAYTLPMLGNTPIGDATRIVYQLSGSNWSATTATVSAADAIAESFVPSITTSIQGAVSAKTRDFQYYIKNNNKEAITVSVKVRKGTLIIDSYTTTIAAETSSTTKAHATTATATFTVDVTFQKYGQLVHQTASKTVAISSSGDGPTILPID